MEMVLRHGADLRYGPQDDVLSPEERPEVDIEESPFNPCPGVGSSPQLDGVDGDLQEEQATAKHPHPHQAQEDHRLWKLG